MGNVITEGVDARGFLERGIEHAYSMEENLIPPGVAHRIIGELRENGQLYDMNELNRTEMFYKKDMRFASLLHASLNGMIGEITDTSRNMLQWFNVRVFEPGEHATTIHRNDESIGPWAVGTILRGEAPFNVYRQDQLTELTYTLDGTDDDPEPADSLLTRPGSGWLLHTGRERLPHSGGIVNSSDPRILLLLYGMKYDR